MNSIKNEDVIQEMEVPDSETEDVKTTVLKNMTVLESNPENILGNHLQINENSDGNLEISTILHAEEIIVAHISEEELQESEAVKNESNRFIQVEGNQFIEEGSEHHFIEEETELNHFIEEENEPNHFIEEESEPNHFIEGESEPNHFIEGQNESNHFIEGQSEPNNFIEGKCEPNHFIEGESGPNHFIEGESETNHFIVAESEHNHFIEEENEHNHFIGTEELIGHSTFIGNVNIVTNNDVSNMISENEIYLTQNYDDANFQEPANEEYQMDRKDKEENPCTLCQRTFKTSASLKRHVTVCHCIEEEQDDPLTFQLCLCCGEPLDSAHTTGDYKCTMCDKRFLLVNSLERHKSIEHSEGGVWQCVDCGNFFSDRKELMEHIQTHPLNKSYSCRQCNREFTRKYHLERHIAQTGCDGTPRNSFQCQVCQKMYSRKDNLRDHLRAHAGQIKPKKLFYCEYCNKEFRGSTLLSVHLRTHTGERPYPCDLCPKRFPSGGAMKKHRRMHTGEKPYLCTKCPHRFAAKETLNRHIRTHTGEKPHSCQFCGKSFIQAAQLRAHIFHHTGENAYTCKHCNRAFNRRARLTMHVKFVHEGEKPLECTQCDKTFFRKEDLARHTMLHTGVKPFKCEVCKKSFAVKSSLKLHMLTHRKEQPCSCDECGRAFIRQDCLLRHMRAKHRDVLEDIMAGAEKKKLQQQLLNAASAASKCGNSSFTDSTIWNELTLTDSIKELLHLLVDESTLQTFGWPDAPVDKLLDSVIRRCGHKPASKEDFDYLGRMRENAKLLFTVVIDDEAVKSLLNNQTVDEVILHVLKLAKS